VPTRRSPCNELADEEFINIAYKSPVATKCIGGGSRLIRRLRLRNFRSIFNSDITFEPLTVLIGANATGKSNVIKALAFVSDVARNRLEPAVLARGGYRELLPRALGATTQGAKLEIELEAHLARPDKYPEDSLPIAVHHAITLGSSTIHPFRVVAEKLRFADVLRVAAALRPVPEGSPSTRSDVPLADVVFARNSIGNVELKLPGRLGSKSAALLQGWLGFGYAESTSPDQLKDILKSLVSGPKPKRPGYSPIDRPRSTHASPKSFWDPGQALSFVPEIVEYISEIGNMQRYDLLLNELRSEQQSGFTSIAYDGRYMPSATAYVKSKNPQRWTVVMETLRDIAPHIRDVGVHRLRSAKDFVGFLEEATAQPVESWEASDGTLRALAILISLERHPADSTILIEEPELGLHPWAVRRLMAHVQQAIKERNIQVIMTTHSTQVLESASPEQVLVASRSPEEGTTLKTLKEVAPLHTIERGDIGRLWDKGLLGGIPNE